MKKCLKIKTREKKKVSENNDWQSIDFVLQNWLLSTTVEKLFCRLKTMCYLIKKLVNTFIIIIIKREKKSKALIVDKT